MIGTQGYLELWVKKLQDCGQMKGDCSLSQMLSPLTLGIQ